MIGTFLSVVPAVECGRQHREGMLASSLLLPPGLVVTSREGARAASGCHTFPDGPPVHHSAVWLDAPAQSCPAGDVWRPISCSPVKGGRGRVGKVVQGPMLPFLIGWRRGRDGKECPEGERGEGGNAMLTTPAMSLRTWEGAYDIEPVSSLNSARPPACPGRGSGDFRILSTRLQTGCSRMGLRACLPERAAPCLGRL